MLKCIYVDLPQSTMRLIHLRGTALIILDGDSILLTTVPRKVRKQGVQTNPQVSTWLGNPLQILVKSEKLSSHI